MVSIPFTNAHREQVDVFIELVKEGNGLNDHVIDTVDVEFQFGAGIRVAETELGFCYVVCLKTFEEFSGVKTDASDELLSFF